MRVVVLESTQDERWIRRVWVLDNRLVRAPRPRILPDDACREHYRSARARRKKNMKLYTDLRLI